MHFYKIRKAKPKHKYFTHICLRYLTGFLKKSSGPSDQHSQVELKFALQGGGELEIAWSYSNVAKLSTVFRKTQILKGNYLDYNYIIYFKKVDYLVYD